MHDSRKVEPESRFAGDSGVQHFCCASKTPARRVSMHEHALYGLVRHTQTVELDSWLADHDRVLAILLSPWLASLCDASHAVPLSTTHRKWARTCTCLSVGPLSYHCLFGSTTLLACWLRFYTAPALVRRCGGANAVSRLDMDGTRLVGLSRGALLAMSWWGHEIRPHPLARCNL